MVIHIEKEAYYVISRSRHLHVTSTILLYHRRVMGETIKGVEPLTFNCLLSRFTFDLIETTAMRSVSSGFTFDIHGITGFIALVLMLIHVLWATWVLVKGTEQQKTNFHKYRLMVWLFWLIPFFIGMIINM